MAFHGSRSRNYPRHTDGSLHVESHCGRIRGHLRRNGRALEAARIPGTDSRLATSSSMSTSSSPAPLTATTAADKKSGLRTRLQSGIGLVALIALALIISPRAPRGGLVFLQWGNITDMLRQVSEIGIIALGMTFVIITGGI